ncbi:rCG28936 [Rattus norvegicus]|uniref:RCG28936 n=1 Tax=Rattus norvegicus TaxID=10116 RepID=A6HW50_RAT|nr:rCG28936 [Rattus norvegicus]
MNNKELLVLKERGQQVPFPRSLLEDDAWLMWLF